MKKILIFLTAAMLILSLLAGCGDRNPGSTGGSASAGTPGSGMNGSSSGSDTTNRDTTNGSGSMTGGSMTSATGNLVDDIIDDFDAAGENTIDGTPDGADTYGATDDTNLDDTAGMAGTR